jgi:hypothetical protein
LLHSGEVDLGKLEAFGGVHGDETDAFFLGDVVVLTLVIEADLVEEAC